MMSNQLALLCPRPISIGLHEVAKPVHMKSLNEARHGISPHEEAR
jgi:hypothetical protein